jgi:hypothetical protein
MGMYKALYGLCLKMVVEMETSHWSGAVITPTTGKKMVVAMETSCWSGSMITPTTGKNINLCRMPRARLQWKSSAAS